MIFSGSSANLQQGFRVDMNWGGIPARKVTGEPLVIYCGVIDILQCYKTLKKLEHRFKAIIYDGKTVSGRDRNRLLYLLLWYSQIQ